MINFKYPIEYQNETKKINDTIKTDLELVKTTDKSLESIYSKYINPTTSLGNKCLEEMSNYYTTNTEYLKNTQGIVSNIDSIKFNKEIIEKTHDNWKNLKSEEYFVEKHKSNFMLTDLISILTASGLEVDFVRADPFNMTIVSTKKANFSNDLKSLKVETSVVSKRVRDVQNYFKKSENSDEIFSQNIN